MGERNMYVRLLRYTAEPEKTIATAAKLCYSSARVDELELSVNDRDQGKFLDIIMQAGHYSTLEHVSFTFLIEGVSRSLLAQITRHRIASFSVQSQRYVSQNSAGKSKKVFDYIIPPRIKALGNEYIAIFEEQMETIQKWYDFWDEVLGQKGESSQEDARFVLPNAAETKIMLTMNARELIHFFNLRCCNRAQWEIRELATRMLILVKEVAPAIFKNSGPSCLTGPCPEGKMSCGNMNEIREKFSKL